MCCGLPTIYTLCVLHNIYVLHPQYVVHNIFHCVLFTIYTLDFPQYIHCCPQHIQPPKNPRVGSPTNIRIYCGGKRISCTGVHSVQVVVGAAVYIVDNSYVLWVHLVDNLLWVRMYCGRQVIYCGYVLWVHAPTLWVRVCIVGAYMLWGTPTHNIYVLHPQYIVRVYILWVNIVGDFSFTDVGVMYVRSNVV